MKRAAIAATALACAGLAALAWWFARAGAGDRGASAPVSAQTATVGASPAPRAQDSAAELRRRLSALPASSPAMLAEFERQQAETMARDPSQRRWMLPIDRVYPELLAAARGGDLAAASVLGQRLSGCQRTLQDASPAKLLEKLDMVLAGEPDPQADPNSRERQANLRRQFAEDVERHDACERVGRAALDEGMTWLEQAGRGDANGARLAYVSAWTQQGGGDRDALIADIERIAARRALAREWLEQGRTAGEEQALDLYVDAYAGQNGLYARDPLQEQAYRYARDLVRGRRTGEFDALWSDGPRRYGTELTSAQWEAAEAQGRGIFKQYYEARPAWRHGPPPRLPTQGR
ncbi:hypothetical protein J5226_00735 [Lysobacter sp. K5869]|uniref:hypothetical protein n=1 Tax=Lysobacter sp. K5869 TaxID=2820808 RepID=UPI001C0634BD|nr:hypothetical protein [Lysobacter sp. K5869]QWP76968.1 hypothetical protein J5226_00735 [Lysobacter sp. K5869]